MVNELYHHGVKGQKWGVRRYQDEWGRTTRSFRIRKGVPGTYIKRGTKFQRITNLDEAKKLSAKKIEHRIYVSRNPIDNEQYKYAMSSLPSNNGDGMALVTFKAKKDLRILEHDRLFQDLVDALGSSKVDILANNTQSDTVKFFVKNNKDKTISQALKDAESNRLYYQTKDRYGNKYDTPHATPFMRDVKREIVSDMFGSSADKKVQREFIKKYEKLGYDAIEDAEDINQGFSTPLIVINPSKSLKHIRSKTIQTGEEYTKGLLGLT